jgi:hypothetical protein
MKDDLIDLNDIFKCQILLSIINSVTNPCIPFWVGNNTTNTSRNVIVMFFVQIHKYLHSNLYILNFMLSTKYFNWLIARL